MATATRTKIVKFLLVNKNSPTSSAFQRGYAYPPSENVPVDDIINHNGRQRAIRYVPGEVSIFTDEQSPDSKLKKRADIIISSGIRIVNPQHEIALLEYMNKCNYNLSNPNRNPATGAIFKEDRPDIDAAKAVEKDKLEMDARSAVHGLKYEEKMALAKALYMNTDREIAEITHDLLFKAKTNPADFISKMNNPKLEVKYLVMEALEDQIIAVNKSNFTISWFGGTTIKQSAPGLDMIDEFVDFLYTEEGKLVRQRIESTMKRKQLENVDMSPEEVFKVGKELGLYGFIGKNVSYKGEEIVPPTKSENVVIERLKDNYEMRTKVIAEILLKQQNN